MINQYLLDQEKALCEKYGVETIGGVLKKQEETLNEN